ncbi:MAG: MATE family efflux transporter [Pseudomonadota bacterium]
MTPPNAADDAQREAGAADPAGDQPPEPAQAARPGIWELALPSILGNLSYSLVGMVQTKFVGELGPQALAAVGAGQRIFFAMAAVFMAVSAGTTALVARAWGAEDYREASRVTMASLVLGALFAIAMSGLGIVLARPMAGLFGLDPETLDLAAENIRWIAAFNLAFSINFILSAALRASGDAWNPLWIAFGVNLLNLPLLYLLVFGNFGAPAMGVAGVGISAGLSFSAGAVALLFLWITQRFRVKHVTGGWWRRARLRRLLDIGYPAAIEQTVFQVGFFMFLMLIGNFYGTEAFAAYNIGVNMLGICMTVGFGFSIAGATLVGQNLGANDFPGAARSGWRAAGLAVLSMGGLGLLVAAFAQELAVYFIGDEPLTVSYTVQFTYILGAMMPLLAIEFAIGGALRGAGDTRFPLMTTFLGLIGMRCGLAALFTWMGLPVVWIYAALVGDYLLKGALLIWRFYRGKWKTLYSNEELSVA